MVIVNVSLIFMLLHEIDPKEMQEVYPNYPNYLFVYGFILTMARISTTIFSAVLLVEIIINEYKYKTIVILFQHPYPRWKLLLSKVLLIELLSLVFFISTLIVSLLFFTMIQSYAAIIKEPITSFLSYRLFLEVLFHGLFTSVIAFIPLFFGMIRYSVKMTLATSSILAFGLYLPINAPNHTNIYGSNLIILLCLTFVGMFVVYHFIYYGNRRDV
ncbi:ABC transporter permease subunit [Bacillus carboniphilus]|uniref:ABC transporter permease subunit n=1 Tax=Bacillus carboniphilus TaxID=86663 RepID=A0ABY9JVI1_9BACI|nr:ABC transporter permease subunit [Bacillus carboniphilus]WLR43417.1 ABC transporter permease subunit [Bacillus carboniphilus]